LSSPFVFFCFLRLFIASVLFLVLLLRILPFLTSLRFLHLVSCLYSDPHTVHKGLKSFYLNDSETSHNAFTYMWTCCVRTYIYILTAGRKILLTHCFLARWLICCAIWGQTSNSWMLTAGRITLFLAVQDFEVSFFIPKRIHNTAEHAMWYAYNISIL
jgi:hypothetical protein